MCGDCRYTTFCDKKIVCMNADSDDYGTVVNNLAVCDNFEPDYTTKDMLKHFTEEDYV